MARQSQAPRPVSVLLFAGLSERQWQFLRLRGYDESDAESARALDLSPRVVEGWKRQPLFRALYAMARSQPKLFAAGELVWRQKETNRPASRAAPAEFVRAGTLLARGEPDRQFAGALRQRELAASAVAPAPPPVDLEVPEQHRRLEPLPREMGAAERRLAEALSVDHCVVLGHWNGQPSLEAWSKHERAVDVAAQFTPQVRMPHWYPDDVLLTTAGLITVADGTLARDVRCPLKARRRCPLVDQRGVNTLRCPYWDLALASWLDREPPAGEARTPICDRDFAIARLLVYVAAATMRGLNGGWSAGFPVITARDEAERAYWQPRIERWNSMILDPWHRIHIVDRETIIDAIVEFRVSEIIGRRNEEMGA